MLLLQKQGQSCFIYNSLGIRRSIDSVRRQSDDSSGITIPTYRLKCSLRQSWQNLCPHLVNTAFLKGNWHIWQTKSSSSSVTKSQSQPDGSGGGRPLWSRSAMFMATNQRDFVLNPVSSRKRKGRRVEISRCQSDDHSNSSCVPITENYLLFLYLFIYYC